MGSFWNTFYGTALGHFTSWGIVAIKPFSFFFNLIPKFKWITFLSVKRLIKQIPVPCLLSWDTKWIIYMSRLVSIFASLTWPRELMSHMCKPPIESMHLLEWLMLEMNGRRSGRSRIVLVKKVTRSKMQITIELKQLQILTVGPFWPQIERLILCTCILSQDKYCWVTFLHNLSQVCQSI